LKGAVGGGTEVTLIEDGHPKTKKKESTSQPHPKTTTNKNKKRNVDAHKQEDSGGRQ